jgi:hypothetical protein
VDLNALRKVKSEKERNLARKNEKAQNLKQQAREVSDLKQKKSEKEQGIEDVPEEPEGAFEQVSKELSGLRGTRQRLKTSIGKDEEKLKVYGTGPPRRGTKPNSMKRIWRMWRPK